MNEDPTYIDDLTGVYNRRYLKERQHQEINTYITHKTPFTVVMVDIDHFKQINDAYGHMKGDQIIKSFAQFLKNTLRTMDTVIRYGGDEFVCIMPHTGKKDAEMTYRRVLDNCKKHDFHGLKITLSAGISSSPDDGSSFTELLDVADQALYDAKRSGRDRIRTRGEKKAEIPMKVFINRMKERDEIRRVIMDYGEGIRIAVLSGNVGIGKTRLGKEVLAGIKGKEVIWCDCIFFSDEIPYYPIREIIKYRTQRLGMEILKDVPLAYKIEIGKLVPEIMIEIEEKIKGLDLVMDKYRLFEGVRRALATGERDKIIIMDNIQWIDKESIEVLKYLLRAMKDSSLTLILIYRSEEMKEALEEFIAYISREVDTTEVALGSFEYQEIKESIKSILGEEPNRNLTDYISHSSGGNPFFIEEIVRGLLDSRYLMIETDTWKFIEPAKDVVPKTLTDIASRKYRTLSTEAKTVLEIASVIGWFDMSILKGITDYNEGHLIGLLDTIYRTGLIKRIHEQFKFSDAVSRIAIYTNYISEVKRMVLHRAVAECLEQQYKDKEHEIIDKLAFHYFHGKDQEKGVKYCLEAGERAEEEYANSNAIRYYSWAYELLIGADAEGKIGVMVDCITKRAKLLSFTGENEEALGDLERGLKLATKIKDKRRQARIRQCKALIYTFIAQYDMALQEAESCLKMYREIGEKREIARALLAMGTIYLHQGKSDRSLQVNTDALGKIKEIDDRIIEANIHNNIGNIYFRQGDYTKALAKYKESLTLCEETGDMSGQSKALNNIGNIYYCSGDYASALSSYENVLKIVRDIGYRANEPLTLRNIGLVYYDMSDYQNAMAHYKEALKIVHDIQSRDDEAMILSDIGDIYNNQGGYEEARKNYEDSLKIAEEIKSKRLACFTLVSLADLCMNLDQRDKAKEFLDKAYQYAEGSKERLQSVLACFCDYYLEQEDFERFREAISTIDELFKEEKTKNFEGDVHILMGRYYGLLKKCNKGEEHFQKALDIFKELKEQLSIGKTYYYWGYMELNRGNKLLAGERIKNALDIFCALGVHGWKQQAEKLLKRTVKQL